MPLNQYVRKEVTEWAEVADPDYQGNQAATTQWGKKKMYLEYKRYMRTELDNSRCVTENRKRKGGSDKKREARRKERKKENAQRCYSS